MALRSKLTIIAGFAPSIINFRKELISLLTLNHEVSVIVPFYDNNTHEQIKSLGVDIYNVPLKLRASNPFSDLCYLYNLYKLLKKIKPQAVLSYTIKPVIWGTIAAKMAGVKNIYSIITGLGYAFTDVGGLLHKCISSIAAMLYKIALRNNKHVIFQNNDDRCLFSKQNIITEQVQASVVNGSGVDTDYFIASSAPSDPVVFLMLARLIKQKGIYEYLEAARALKCKYPYVQFKLGGYFEADHPDMIIDNELKYYVEANIIEYLGPVKDVKQALDYASIYVLPSYREGVPRSVLEAMSMGRGIITTNAPGCKETVIDGYNGFLVEPQSAVALQNAMEKVISTPSLIATLGKNSRELAVDKFDVASINQEIIKLLAL